MSARVGDRQSLQEARVSVGRVARGAGLEPSVQVSWSIQHPSSQLAIHRSIAVEPQLGERAFGEPDIAGGGFCTNDLGQLWHCKTFLSKCGGVRERAYVLGQRRRFWKESCGQ